MTRPLPQPARRWADADDAAADAHARRSAFDKRARAAHEELEAARTLHDHDAIADSEKRIRINQEAAAAADDDLKIAERRVADLRAAEDTAASLNDARVRLVDVRAQLPRLQDDLAVAHDGVFAAQQRLDAAIQNVALALHDRDEALWMLHRDEIFAGRSTFDGCGFRVDFSVWGGHRPADIEVLHAYYVHPVTYWVERPAEIDIRLVEVDRITEVTRVRDIQRKHEGPTSFGRTGAGLKPNYPAERRRAYFEKVTVERQRLVAERTEREAATREHRAPRIPDSERAEARAIAAKDHAQAKGEKIEARADARSEKIEARADANAKVTEARADAKSEKIEARADANAKVTEA